MNISDETKTDRQCLSDMIKQRYESRLTPEETEALQKAVSTIFDTVDALRSVKLENSDEPFTRLVPYRKER